MTLEIQDREACLEVTLCTSSAKMQATDQMSTPGAECVVPSRTSGARYHRVTICRFLSSQLAVAELFFKALTGGL